jgi:hypothetical protein
MSAERPDWVVTGAAQDAIRSLDQKTREAVIDELETIDVDAPTRPVILDGKTYSATLLPSGYTAVYRRLGPGERGSIRHDEGTTYVIFDVLPPESPLGVHSGAGRLTLR